MSPGVIDKAVASSSFSSGALGAAAADTEALGGEALDVAALGAATGGAATGGTIDRGSAPQREQARFCAKLRIEHVAHRHGSNVTSTPEGAEEALGLPRGWYLCFISSIV